MAEFDPYYKWLGIPPDEQPPHHYRLLSIKLFESDADVIDAAADRQMTFLRQVSSGRHMSDAQRLLNHIAAARVCLLNAGRKQEYDTELQVQLGSASGRAPQTTRPAGAVVPASGVPATPEIAVSDPMVTASARSHRRSNATRWMPILLGALAILLVASIVLWYGKNEVALPTRDFSDPARTPAGTTTSETARKPPEAAKLTPAGTPAPHTESSAAVLTSSPRSPMGNEAASTAQTLAGELAICGVLQAKRAPIDLAPGVIAFVGPGGNGRSGANGVFVPAPLAPAGGGTQWSFEYVRSGSARGIQIIHPLGAGHIIASLQSGAATVVAGGSWSQLKYEQQVPGVGQRTADYEGHFPFEPDEPRSIISRLFADGRYELLVNGRPLITAQIDDAQPFALPNTFQGDSLPLQWPAGSAGLLIGPLDGGINRAVSLRLQAPASADGPRTAATDPKPTPLPTAPPPIAPPPVAATAPAPQPVTAKEPARETPPVAGQEPSMVWEVHFDKRTRMVQLFENGRSSEHTPWKQSGSKLEWEAFGYAMEAVIQPDGLAFTGRLRGGAYAEGRLVAKGLFPATQAAAASTNIKPRTAVDDRLRGELTQTLPDVFELVITSRQDRYLRLSVLLTDEGRVLAHGQKVADWKMDHRRLNLKFIDDRLGDGPFANRNLLEFTARRKAENGDEFSFTLKRVQLVSVWDRKNKAAWHYIPTVAWGAATRRRAMGFGRWKPASCGCSISRATSRPMGRPLPAAARRAARSRPRVSPTRSSMNEPTVTPFPL